jgi:hypothetical protein
MKRCGMTLAALVLSCGVAAKAAAIRASNDPVKDERPITAKDREHWAWKPLMKVEAADLDAVVAIKTPIEKEAYAATLIRRVTFDLTGLPPSAADLSDWSDKKYEALVDRLLASPRYGEHWAQWWLDLARFAESDGFEYDEERGRAWQYRDWIIEALNKDMRPVRAAAARGRFDGCRSRHRLPPRRAGHAGREQPDRTPPHLPQRHDRHRRRRVPRAHVRLRTVPRASV